MEHRKPLNPLAGQNTRWLGSFPSPSVIEAEAPGQARAGGRARFDYSRPSASARVTIAFSFVSAPHLMNRDSRFRSEPCSREETETGTGSPGASWVGVGRSLWDTMPSPGLWEVWASLGDVQGPVDGHRKRALRRQAAAASVHRAGTFHRPRWFIKTLTIRDHDAIDYRDHSQ